MSLLLLWGSQLLCLFCRPVCCFDIQAQVLAVLSSGGSWELRARIGTSWLKKNVSSSEFRVDFVVVVFFLFFHIMSLFQVLLISVPSVEDILFLFSRVTVSLLFPDHHISSHSENWFPQLSAVSSASLINSLLQLEANLSERNWPLTCSFLVCLTTFSSKSQSSWKHHLCLLLFHWFLLLPTPDASLSVYLPPQAIKIAFSKAANHFLVGRSFLSPLCHAFLHSIWTMASREFSSPCVHCSEWVSSSDGFCFSYHIRLLFKDLSPTFLFFLIQLHDFSHMADAKNIM